jgi:recombination protein RecR
VRIDYPPAIQRLVAQLKSLPGLGPRSAERLMLWLLQMRDERITSLSNTLLEAKERIVPCPTAASSSRRQRLPALPRSAAPAKVALRRRTGRRRAALERSGAFQGLYHVLGGRLSPLDNVTPEDLAHGVAREPCA